MVGDIAGAKDNLEHNLLNPFNVTDVFGCEHRGEHWSSIFQYRTDLHCIEEQDIIITDTSRFQSRDGPESTVGYQNTLKVVGHLSEPNKPKRFRE